MKQYFGLGVGLLAGAMIGAAAVTGLHAQAKPPVFFDHRDRRDQSEAYGKEFAPKAQATIKGAGAKFVLIGGTGGASAKPITSLEGMPPKRITVQQWENMDALKAWYNSKDYQDALAIGKKYATFRRYAVEGE
jgi:uncharacterized protein (DUF1330 family)